MPVDLQALYPKLIHLMLDTVFVVDRHNQIVFVSDACEALRGGSAGLRGAGGQSCDPRPGFGSDSAVNNAAEEEAMLGVAQSRRSQLAAFFVLTYGISWALWLGLAGLLRFDHDDGRRSCQRARDRRPEHRRHLSHSPARSRARSLARSRARSRTQSRARSLAHSRGAPLQFSPVPQCLEHAHEVLVQLVTAHDRLGRGEQV